MRTLTIFTPTYNRENTLPRLYNSLKAQTSKDFLWLIVDDGSSDNTKKLIQQYMEEEQIDIKYIYQENAGKVIAHNTGVINCTTELFYDIDSDDYPPVDAVEQIICIWKEEGNEKLAGIIALKAYDEKKIIGNKYPDNIHTAKLLDLYRLHGKEGDTSLIFRTDILKENYYPHFNGEKRMPISYVYTKINQQYDMIVKNIILCYCEYLADGITRTGTRAALLSPKGFALDKRLMMDCEPYKKDKRKALVGYVMYSFLGKETKKAILDIGIFKFVAACPFALGMYIRLKFFCLKQKRRKNDKYNVADKQL